MSEITLSARRARAVVAASSDAGLRAPDELRGEGPLPHGILTLVYVPDLTPEEQATLDELVATALDSALLSPEDWAAIQSRMATLRTFRQMSQSEFLALTANQRDRALQDAVNDLTAILFRVLRSS